VVILEAHFRVSQQGTYRLTGEHRNTQRPFVPLTVIKEQKLKRRIRGLAHRYVL